MTVEIDPKTLRGRSLFIGTPMYGGMCGGPYTQACIDLAATLQEMKIPYKFYYLFNASLITLGRNYIADAFMRSGFSHLLFIDSDVSFHPKDVLDLLTIADPDSDKDVVCGSYPRKTINWANIQKAAAMGFGDPDPSGLAKYAGTTMINALDGQEQISLTDPVRVKNAGTGFMMIQRKTLETFQETFPELSFVTDNPEVEEFKPGREVMAYFDTYIDPMTRSYLSEDYMFCEYCGQADLKIWLCPWIELDHMGSYIYSGAMSDLAKLQGP